MTFGYTYIIITLERRVIVMLCQFTFKNYKSYKNEVTLDLQATKAIGFNESLLQFANDEEQFLPVSVIYGPNAGGKSNVLNAFGLVYSLVMNPVSLFKTSSRKPIAKWSTFAFDDVSRNSAAEFELFFRPNNEYEYKYSIKILENKIIEENLYRRKIGVDRRTRITNVFERNSNGIELGACINKYSINTEVNDKMPFLSFLAINYKLAPINIVIDWFERCYIRDYADPDTEQHILLADDDEFKANLIKLLNSVGINVSNFEFVETPSKKETYELFFDHTVNGRTFRLNVDFESAGTQKLFNILPFVLLVMSEGGLLVIDELDAKLHPKLLKYVVMLFKNPEINKKNAQLIFTSHDVSTLKSSVYRIDEVWFACKLADESSELYSLADIRDENNNHIQPSAAFDKQYLEGRYGADPYFQNMMDWK